jgi:murein DD-endopeptidase MepM/ murein hydrolase activator NlpD
MPQKITITIPTSGGEQAFFVGKKTTIALLSIFIGAPVLLTVSINRHQDSRIAADLAANEASDLIGQQAQLIQSKSEQLEQFENSNHLLNQELAEKNNQLVTLSKRIYDVESVLGLDNAPIEPDTLDLEQRVDVAAVNSAVRATMFRLIPNDTPMSYNRVSSAYGRRLNPITGKSHTHTGIDLTCKRGEPIVAPADGVVETVRPSKKGFGNFLIMRHSFGFTSSYAHLQDFKVKSGEFIAKGEPIASCGNSGNSTGPHLHYEVRFLGRSLNPQYLMDWTPENFETLFEKESKVKWAPLVKLIDNVVRLQVNLTNHPYKDDSVDTAKSEGRENTQVN